jgi:carbonic anhydrase
MSVPGSTVCAVIRQVKNVASDVFVQDAWARGQSLGVHGWVYFPG